jgi:hypothetical protein
MSGKTQARFDHLFNEHTMRCPQLLEGTSNVGKKPLVATVSDAVTNGTNAVLKQQKPITSFDAAMNNFEESVKWSPRFALRYLLSCSTI